MNCSVVVEGDSPSRKNLTEILFSMNKVAWANVGRRMVVMLIAASLLTLTLILYEMFWQQLLAVL